MVESYKVIRLYGCVVTWLHGYMVIGLNGYKCTRL